MADTDNPRRRILLVDDEPGICDTVKLLLQRNGHQVATAYDAAQALALLAEQRFDVVVTDYMMPGMKGDRLAAAIRERLPHEPIIMMTAYAATLELSEKRLPGVDALVGKPFQMEELHRAIADVCARRQDGGSPD